jgi:hypothetical protein
VISVRFEVKAEGGHAAVENRETVCCVEGSERTKLFVVVLKSTNFHNWFVCGLLNSSLTV